MQHQEGWGLWLGLCVCGWDCGWDDASSPAFGALGADPGDPSRALPAQQETPPDPWTARRRPRRRTAATPSSSCRSQTTGNPGRTWTTRPSPAPWTVRLSAAGAREAQLTPHRNINSRMQWWGEGVAVLVPAQAPTDIPLPPFPPPLSLPDTHTQPPTLRGCLRQVSATCLSRSSRSSTLRCQTSPTISPTSLTT